MPDVDMAQLRTEMPKTSVHEFLEVELELSNTTVEALESKLKRMRDISIEDHLKAQGGAARECRAEQAAGGQTPTTKPT